MSAHESSESPPAVHEDGAGEDQPAKRQKRSRACQACRAMKIRCLPVEGQEACKACSKVNRECIMPGPARKRQKTVHKVAELEKKINALTASLAQKNNSSSSVPTPPTESPATTSTPSTRKPDKEYPVDVVVERAFSRQDPIVGGHADGAEDDSGLDDYEDVITRGLVDEATAVKIHDHWRAKMCPCHPLVSFSDKITMTWLRQKRPMTFLSILAVASGLVSPKVQPDLGVEIARQLSDRVMFYHEKSLDLVHAMIIYSTWYSKHKFAKDLGYNHLIHSAVAMCLDLGLGKRSRSLMHSDPARDAEVRRTWMGCYFMAGSVATVLRLPPSLSFSPYLEECLESLANHPAALPSDKFLCCLVRLQHLVQDVGHLFHMDDPGSNIRLDDNRTKYSLKLFERQLDDWKAQSKEHMPAGLLEQYDSVISLYIHEIALHTEHNVDDFRPMAHLSNAENGTQHKDFLSNAHLEAVTICVDSMQRALDSFHNMDTQILRNVPSLHIVWTAYVAIAMIRLHGILAVPDSKYGSIFLPRLRVGEYLDKCVHKLGLVLADGTLHTPAESFIIGFKKLKAWHIHRTQPQGNSKVTDMVPFPTTNYVDGCKKAEAEQQAASQGTGAVPDDLQQPFSCANDNSQQKQQLLQQYQQQGGGHPLPQAPYIQQQQQQQQQFPAQRLPNPNLNGGTNNISLLDPGVPIDASTFDVNWDFTVGDLDNFETYLNDPGPGWMGYLL